MTTLVTLDDLVGLGKGEFDEKSRLWFPSYLFHSVEARIKTLLIYSDKIKIEPFGRVAKIYAFGDREPFAYLDSTRELDGLSIKEEIKQADLSALCSAYYLVSFNNEIRLYNMIDWKLEEGSVKNSGKIIAQIDLEIEKGKRRLPIGKEVRQLLAEYNPSFIKLKRVQYEGRVNYFLLTPKKSS